MRIAVRTEPQKSIENRLVELLRSGQNGKRMAEFDTASSSHPCKDVPLFEVCNCINVGYGEEW